MSSRPDWIQLGALAQDPTDIVHGSRRLWRSASARSAAQALRPPADSETKDPAAVMRSRDGATALDQGIRQTMRGWGNISDLSAQKCHRQPPDAGAFLR